MVVDGRCDRCDGDGFFLGATLLDHVTPDMDVYRDEIFGPVLCVVRAETYDEALDADQREPVRQRRRHLHPRRRRRAAVRAGVEVGMVGINVPSPSPSRLPLRRLAGSLFGDSHMYGPEGVRFYTRNKVVTTRWPDPATSTVDLGFPRSH